MKRCFAALALALTMLAALVGNVSSDDVDVAFADGTRLADMASLFSRSEYAELSRKLDDVSGELGYDVVVVTAPTIGYSTPRDYADDYYDQHGYGRDGILLLINIGERDIYFSTVGKCISIFTDYGIDYLVGDIGSYLTDGEYTDAVERFIDRCRDFTAEYESGGAYDVGNELPAGPGAIALRAVVCIAVGFVAAFIATGMMRSKLRTVRWQAAASSYIRDQSLEVTQSRELFLYRNVVRTAIPRNNSSSRGGGSSTHVSSGGVRHGGGGGKF